MAEPFFTFTPHFLSLSRVSSLCDFPLPRVSLFTESRKPSQSSRSVTSALETDPVRLVVKFRSKPTCYPDRKARNPATISTGFSPGFHHDSAAIPAEFSVEFGMFSNPLRML
ncbi:unnamed protein product [Prunus armeniaca]